MYKKLKYKLDGAEVVRTDMIYHKTDELYIPFDPDNTDYQEYSTININEEMYFSNRTLPKYLLQRYSTKNFGTGNYSLLKYDIKLPN